MFASLQNDACNGLLWVTYILKAANNATFITPLGWRRNFSVRNYVL